MSTLQSLNSAGTAGVESLRPWYDLAAAIDPDLYAEYAFEQWLGFLQTARLVNVSEGTVAITLEGREFLTYLIRQGYSLTKDG